MIQIKDEHRKEFTTRQECTDFLKSVIYDYKCNTHPDDSFVDLVDVNTDEPSFAEDDAKVLDARMNECFEILGDEIYDIDLAIFNEYCGWN